MSHTTFRLLSVLAVVLLVGATIGPATASPGADASLRGDPVVRQEGSAPSTPANNSTQHENPDEVNENGDVDQVTRWLNSRMSQQLRESTLQLSQGEYEQARGVIGDDYNDMLSKYVDVAGDTAGSGDDETAAEFEEAKDEQAEYVSAVESYRETRAEYREAKANGNETRARELARNLSTTADRIQQLNGNLTESYETIGNQTGVSFDEETAVVQNITQNVTAQQQEIAEAEFSRTRVAASADTEAVSFAEPLHIRGRVTAENGTPIANETGVIAIAGQTYEVALDAGGAFTLAYRPVRLPLDSDAVRVRYRPAADSQYLGSNTTVPVEVTQTTPEIGVSLNSTEVAYGDVVRVSGRVAAAKRGVPGVPVGVVLGTRATGSSVTGSDGTYSQLVRIGANTQPGRQSVRAVTGFDDRAVGRVNASTQLHVVETPTRLTLEGSVVGDQVVLQGRLLTADGRPVPGQAIELALTDEQFISVTTNETGHFRTVVRSELYDPDANATITAAYRGTSTNLESAQTEAVVQIPAQGIVLPVDRAPVLLGLGFVVALAAGGWVVRRRRRETTAAAPAVDDGERGPLSGASASANLRGLRQAVGAAVTLSNEGANADAIERLYPAVRQYLTASFDLPATGTHWEFYHAVVDDPAIEAWAPVVRSLTEAYELATYAEADVGADTVETVLDHLDERLDALSADAAQ